MRALDRVRTSQFGIPALVIAAGIAAAVGANIVDDAGFLSDSGLVLPTTRSAAQTLLSTVATSTITVAAIVFSVTAVVSQLAASQYSPRVLQAFLDDRYQQIVLGLVAGTFAFALIGQSLISGPPDQRGGNVTATAGVILGVVSVVAIIGFIGRVTVRVRVDDTIGRIADETSHAMRTMFARDHDLESAADNWAISSETATAICRANANGWVTGVDIEAVLDRLPAGGRARIDTAVGEHVNVGDRILTVWTTDPDEAARTAEGLGTVVVDLRGSRTISEDPGFGFRQMVDIALRALSDGVNDPNTAAEVVRQLVEPLRIGLTGPQPRRVVHGSEGRAVYMPHQPDGLRFFEDAFRDIRLAASRQPTVAAALISAGGSLAESSPEPYLRPVCAEMRRIVEAVDSWGLDPDDRRSALSQLQRYEPTRPLYDELVSTDR